MIPVAKAARIVKQNTGTLGTDTVALPTAVGRVLAEDILADSDLPPFNRSQMDGFALHAKDIVSAPVTLKIAGEAAAGHGWRNRLRSGEAVRIMTGAPVPAGADTVQKVELTDETGGNVTILEPAAKGRNIVRRGAEIRKGSLLIRRGEVITDRNIASLAAFGYAQVRVGNRPAVSVLATGSEIVPVRKTPGRDQIRNSNSVMLKALSEAAGARVTLLRDTGDKVEKLIDVISRAVNAKKNCPDILVITGGVSVGKYDLTKAALQALGAEIFFERVRLRPGKPTVFARVNNTLVFGLPGNPVSAAVTFCLFVRPAILKLQGARAIELSGGFARLTQPAKAAKERDTFLPATLATDNSGRLLATPLRWQGSSDFVGFAKADALVFIPAGETVRGSSAARILFLDR